MTPREQATRKRCAALRRRLGEASVGTGGRVKKATPAYKAGPAGGRTNGRAGANSVRVSWVGQHLPDSGISALGLTRPALSPVTSAWTRTESLPLALLGSAC